MQVANVPVHHIALAQPTGTVFSGFFDIPNCFIDAPQPIKEEMARIMYNGLNFNLSEGEYETPNKPGTTFSREV